jgi:hypothetical protein
VGEHVVVAALQGGGTAAYRLASDGQLSLVLQSGMDTPLGAITSMGRLGSRGAAALNPPASWGYSYDTHLIPGSGGGVVLNRQGQVALTVQLDGGPDTVVLLTPKQP